MYIIVANEKKSALKNQNKNWKIQFKNGENWNHHEREFFKFPPRLSYGLLRFTVTSGCHVASLEVNLAKSPLQS